MDDSYTAHYKVIPPHLLEFAISQLGYAWEILLSSLLQIHVFKPFTINSSLEAQVKVTDGEHDVDNLIFVCLSLLNILF